MAFSLLHVAQEKYTLGARIGIEYQMSRSGVCLKQQVNLFKSNIQNID